MPFLGESSILFGGFTGPTAGYVPAGAILLDGSADYLTQTFSSSGDRDDYTRSVWVKRSGLSSDMRIFDTGPDGGNNLESLYFDSNNNLFWTVNDSNVTCYNYETSAVFRDPTAWTHIVCSRTGTTLTLYVNGVAVSAFDTSTNNVTTNNGRWTHTDQNVIGRYFLSGSQYFNGYLAEIIQIDGTALGADSFGEFDANGNWVPIDPSELTFGTNGFWLDFAESQPTRITSGTKTSSAGTAANAFDDDTGTINNFATQADGQWVKLDYGSAIGIVSSVIWQEQINACGYTVAIQYSDNDTDWTTAATKTHAASLSPTHLSWDTVGSHRYWRCYFTGWTGASNANVAEFFLYGTYGLGKDVSGNRNDFYVNSSPTSTNDNPVDDATNGYGNYATLNPLDQYNASGSMTFSDGNIAFTPSTTGIHIPWLTQALSTNDTTKYYFEIETPSGNDLGAYITNQALNHASATRNVADTWYCGLENTTTFRANEEASGNIDATLSATYDYSADRMGVCLSPSTGKVWVGHVDASEGTSEWKGPSTSMNGDPAAGTNATLTPDTQNGSLWQLGVFNSNGSGRKSIIHMDAASWVGTPPTGFDNELATQNLPTPTVTDPSAYFGTILWSGDSSSPRSLTGFTDGSGNNVTPDLVWIKSRSDATSHTLWDVVRGVGGSKELLTDGTNAEGSQGTTNGHISSLDSGGFTVAAGSINDVYTNESGRTYVAWCLKAGGSGSSNTDGTESSTVSVADHNGFAIVSWTNNATPGTGDTVGHGMGQAPEMLILKSRDDGSDGWHVWHKDLTSIGYYVKLNTTGAEAVDSGNAWDGTAPTSSVFSIGDGDGTNWTNTANHDMVAYAFARTPGLIGIGSYTGNGSADGPYVVVDDGGSGFRPAFLLIKNINDARDWQIYDNRRPGYNVPEANAKTLQIPTLTETNRAVDFTANGFKVRSTAQEVNNSGHTLIYLAFAEYPFGGNTISQARAR